MISVTHHIADPYVGRLLTPAGDLRGGKLGHKPTLDTALERLADNDIHGDSDLAFGGSYLTEATLFREKSCVLIAVE